MALVEEVNYEDLLFPSIEAKKAASMVSLNNNYYMIKEYPPPDWCSLQTVAIAITRLNGLALYSLRKEAEARRRIVSATRIHGGADCEAVTAELNTAEFYRGQAILARASKAWLTSLN